MDDSRKKPSWAFWTTVVVAALTIYVLSIGPAAWLHERTTRDGATYRSIECIYAPIIYAILDGPHDSWALDLLQQYLQEYIDFWAQ